MLVFVWRVQDLFPILSLIRFPIIASTLAIGLVVATPTLRVLASRLRHPVVILAATILVLMLLSVSTSLYRGLSFRFIFSDHIKTLLMMVITLGSVRAFRDVERLATVTVVGAALYSTFILTRFEIGPSGRLSGLVYYDANDLGMFLVCTLPLAVYFARLGRTLVVRLLAAGTAVLLLVTLVRTGSRGAFLALVAVGLFLLVWLTAVPRLTRVAWLGGLVAVLLVVGNQSYWRQMQTILDPSADYNWAGKEETGRLEIWKRGLGYMLRRPLTGVGVAAFGVAEGTISPLAERQERGIGLKWSAAHNSFVQIGAELGFGGLLCFLAMLFAAWRTLRQLGRASPSGTARERMMAQALTASLIGYVVAGFFLSQAYAAYLYAMLAMVVGFAATGGRLVVGRATRRS